eukprot:m.35917 g.35917  ORF g.35917 m.35917 type:complete len:85 (-) comp17226_c0_seq1:34-288(-)
MECTKSSASNPHQTTKTPAVVHKAHTHLFRIIQCESQKIILQSKPQQHRKEKILKKKTFENAKIQNSNKIQTKLKNRCMSQHQQ